VKLEGSYTFEAPRDVVWEALLDPDVLVNALPGTEKLEKVGENDYKGTLKIKVGPVQGQFQGTVTLSDLKPPKTYKMSVNGRGPAGFMRGEGNVRLEIEGDTTVMHYDGDAQVGGRIASVGQRLIDSTSKQITRQALENIHKQITVNQTVQTAPSPQVDENESPATAPASDAEYEPPSQAQFAVDVARDVFDDLVPLEKRPILIAAILGVLAMFIVLNWWTNRLAHRVAYILEQRR
jgi:hypothetical protein